MKPESLKEIIIIFLHALYGGESSMDPNMAYLQCCEKIYSSNHPSCPVLAPQPRQCCSGRGRRTVFHMDVTFLIPYFVGW